MTYTRLLREKCDPESYSNLMALENHDLMDFIGFYTDLCQPSSIFVRTDSPRDARYVRKQALSRGEEHPLATEGHTVHFDGYHDQGRDKKITKFLVTPHMTLGPSFNTLPKDQGVEEIHSLMEGIMKGSELYVLFLALGPLNSPFSIYAVQLTDSAYVAHSEDILYRPAYEIFKKNPNLPFFRYIHSAGVLDERKNSVHVERRRVYIDLEDNIVYSINTQYAGNTVGLKKLALRLAIQKAQQEDWLAEHMFIMAVHGEGRKTYFTGAFPSACGKTSTCMVEGERIVGDDIAYLRKRPGGVYAVNVERGILGIIKDVNRDDDPLMWEVLNSPGEIIFSNILVCDGVPLWQGDGKKTPRTGFNFSGEWQRGKRDEEGTEIPFAHPNGRYTLGLDALKNCDPVYEAPEGVKIQGIIYGGRDSDTWPPLFQSFDWKHGVITIAASLESETTSATLGKEGVKELNPMANRDFLSIPLGKYISHHLSFIKGMDDPPIIFGVNYFHKNDSGEYITSIHDKQVWLKWMERRVHGEVGAIMTPMGHFPLYDDLVPFFKGVLHRTYPYTLYETQFTLPAQENLDKITRIQETYASFDHIPGIVFRILQEQKGRLHEVIKRHGPSIPPRVWEIEK
ncbi:MAG: phosphoenolpyruvate carboxykinase (GTP) [Theionarchaea archaeon]|nr:phosphoenolpyruvate carboxykinase (GTP) [Theionarchaea archaeon]